jgi:hypothetical protein
MQDGSDAPRRARAFVTAGIGLVALVVGSAFGFVSCDPGPLWWASLAGLFAAATGVCAWGALSARPRSLLTVGVPSVPGAILAGLTVLMIMTAIGSPSDEQRSRAERCRDSALHERDARAIVASRR